MAEIKQAKIQAVYDKDTFRCHRYFVNEQDGIKGTLYVDKSMKEVPKEIIIEMKVKGN